MIQLVVRRPDDGQTYPVALQLSRLRAYRAYIASIGHQIVSETPDAGEDLQREAHLDELAELLPKLRILVQRGGL